MPLVDVLGELIGASPPVVAVKDRIRRLLARQTNARRLPPVLIEGETGTGKGLLARLLHRAGPRANGPFVDVNCAAIPDTLIESEMFGFERGAFTDARHAKAGLFQTADQGTLFLDEVGLLPEAVQAKLLKVIEERAVRRLGSTRTEPIDVWIVAGTNEDLAAAVRERRFREDLYHRLAVLTIPLSPLRERGDDVLLLAEHFLARACADYDLAAKTLGQNAREALLGYPWPGNIRELGNVMERVALLADGSVVTAATLALPSLVRRALAPARSDVAPSRERTSGGQIDNDDVLDALAQTDWNISRAAARLGITRNALRYRIEKHGLRPGREREPAPAPRSGSLSEKSVAPSRAPESASVPAAAFPSPVVSGISAVRWERRRLTLLRADVVVDRRGGPERRADASVMAPPPPDAPSAPGNPWSSSISGDTGRPLAVVMEKAQSFGGRVEEVSASRVIAAFGLAPVEDSPRRAANAALAIRKAAERSRSAGAEPPWSVTLGIHSGEVTVAVAGGAVTIDHELKQRIWTALDELMTSAVVGDVVVSAPAARLLERRFDLAAAEAPSLQAWRLVGHERAGLTLSGRMAKFVGRRQEIDLLRGRFEAAQRGQGQVVGLVGEAGIGKSRLLFEFRQSLPAGVTVYREGACQSYGASIPYLPVLDLVRSTFGITDVDPPETMTAKVIRGLEAAGMESDDALANLLQLLGLKDGAERLATLGPEVIKARTFETLRQLLLRSSRHQPLVIVVEDLHWVDRTSEECLATLIDILGGAGILFVATYRPGYRPPWADKSYATQIALQPLGAEDSTTIVHSVLGTEAMALPLIDAILGKADGNPFFLEEMARAVREQGGRSGPVDVPDTLQELVLARMDRLADGSKRALRAASVLGRRFSLKLLRAIWEDPIDPEPYLRELARQEFLYEEIGGEETVYVFKHAVSQDVAYATLLDAPRARYHAAAGVAIWESFAGRVDEVVEILAYHFGRSGDDEKSVDYAILAAEKAQRRWANAEALSHFDAALKRLAAMPETAQNRIRRIDAVVKQAEVKFALGQHAEHIQDLEGIRALVERAQDARRRAAWCYWTGFLHSLTGSRPEVAIAYCREAVAIADREGLEETRAFAECSLAQVYVVAGELRAALDAGERALAIFEARGNVWWACRALWQLSAAANALGDWERSLGYCRRALDYGRGVDDLRLKVVGLWRTGSTHAFRGDAVTAIRCCDEALALSPLPFDEAMVRATRGHALVKAGEAERGTAEQEGALAWLARSHLRYTRSAFALILAEDHLRYGDAERTRAIVDEVLDACREAGHRHLEAVGWRVLGEYLARTDRHAAVRRLERARTALDAMEAHNELGKALVGLGEIRAHEGDVPGARALFERGLEIFESLGTLGEPERVRLLRAGLDH